MNIVAYPHIQTHRYYTPAETRVLVLDLKTAPVNVGYIMGSGDEVPDAIRQMGMNVTMLGERILLRVTFQNLTRSSSVFVPRRRGRTL